MQTRIELAGSSTRSDELVGLPVDPVQLVLESSARSLHLPVAPDRAFKSSEMAFTHFATWMVAASLVAATVYADCPAANYTISVEYTWQASDDTDANPYPSNAHFSPMVCALSKKATGFVVNSTASAGFKMLAEEGKDADLVKALNDSSDVDVVGTINATAEGTSTGKFSMVLSAKEGYSYIMCVAMIAPSPGMSHLAIPIFCER